MIPQIEKEKYPVSRKENLVVQYVDKELLVYDLDSNRAFCLNQPSAFIWENCDGKTSVSKIKENLSRKLGTSVNDDFVLFALGQLKKEKLLENEVGLPDYFEGMSRREVVKRVGLGSMIALPLIASIAAPTAIHGQSICASPTNRPNGCPCDNNLQCQSLDCMGKTTMECGGKTMM